MQNNVLTGAVADLRQLVGVRPGERSGERLMLGEEVEEQDTRLGLRVPRLRPIRMV